MLVTAWKNGTFESSQSSFGLKIQAKDRKRFFRESWKCVIVQLPNGKKVSVNISKPSFWNDTCRELIHVEFRKWFDEQGLIPWEHGNPPKLELTHISENEFTLNANG